MFGFFKLQNKPLHEIPDVKSINWESILNRLYTNLSKDCDPFLAIASNTEKGILPGFISFRIKKGIDDLNHQNILSLNKYIFNDFYVRYFKQNELDQNDYYHLDKKRKIEKDCLVYPIHLGMANKALVIFDYPIENEILNEICHRVSTMIDK